MSYKQILKASKRSLRQRLAYLADLALRGSLDERGQREFALIEEELLARGLNK